MPDTRTVPYDGNKIREIRERKGLSRDDLAERTGRHPETIRNLENNNKNASIAMIMGILHALGIEYGEIAPCNVPTPAEMWKTAS